MYHINRGHLGFHDAANDRHGVAPVRVAACSPASIFKLFNLPATPGIELVSQQVTDLVRLGDGAAAMLITSPYVSDGRGVTA